MIKLPKTNMNYIANNTPDIQNNSDLCTQIKSALSVNKDLVSSNLSKLLSMSASESTEKSNYSVIPELPTAKELDLIFNKLKNKINLTKSEELKLISKIEKNNPALSIFTKLNRWDYFETIIFSWIKQLNDKTSQSFTDKVLLRFKNSVLRENPWVEVVWNDYKNFTLKITKVSNFNSQYLKILLSKAFAKELSTSKYNGKIIPDLLKVFNKKWVIWGKTQEEILHNIAHVRLSLERQSLRTNVLKKWEIKLKEKELQLKYSDTNGEILDKIELPNWYFYYIKNNVLYYEFESWWINKIDKTLIFWPDWKLTINFITKIRKKEIPEEMNIYQQSRILINSYIGRGEFIAPVIKESNLPDWQIIDSKKTDKYLELKDKLFNNSLQDTDISQIQYLAENTYKNALDKNSFYNKVKSSWEMFYIDIKDMWSINIKDFSDKIEVRNNWEINTKEIISRSWEYMTERFQFLNKALKKSLSTLYPWKEIYISIWWDEIMIFVEWISKNNSLESLVFITWVFKQLDFWNLEWRITYRYINDNEVKVWWEKLIEGLDELTRKTKAIEKRISSIKNNLLIAFSKTFSHEEREKINSKLLELSLLKNFSLTIEDGVEYIIFYSNPFEDISSKLELSIVVDNNLKLRPNPPSPFTKYLDDHWFGRWKNRT